MQPLAFSPRRRPGAESSARRQSAGRNSTRHVAISVAPARRGDVLGVNRYPGSSQGHPQTAGEVEQHAFVTGGRAR